MHHVDEVARSLPEFDRKVLVRALKSSVGFWTGSALPILRLTELFSDKEGPLVGGTLEGLRAAGLLAIEGDEVMFTEFGYRVAQRALAIRISAPDAGLATGSSTGPRDFPWEVPNPVGHNWKCDSSFLSDIKVARGDGRLRRELISKMEEVLHAPSVYGKWLSGVRHGQRECYVSNYRLIWRLEEDVVIFLVFRSKEDRRVSPFGA